MEQQNNQNYRKYTMNVDTIDEDTMNVDTIDEDTMNVDTIDEDTMNVDTMNVDTIDEDTMNVDTIDEDNINEDTIDEDTIEKDIIDKDGSIVDTDTIDFLHEDDNKLIDSDKVTSQVDIYIKNYNSDIMKEYKTTFNKLYQKYSNKKYLIKNVLLKDKYNNIKIVVIQNKDKKIIKEIIKPKYIYYDDNNNLYTLKNKISNEREELLFNYKLLLLQIEVSQEDKLEFEKKRNNFINLLEEYYSYTLYHKKINKISQINKSTLTLYSFLLIEDNDMYKTLLSGANYNIDTSIINDININNSDKLTQYNNIILQLIGKHQEDIKKDTKLVEEIKLYLNNKNKIDLLKKIKDTKTLQDNYINYIISKLPVIN